MAGVSGDLTSVGWTRMDTPYQTVLRFHPRWEGSDAGVRYGRVLPSQPVEVPVIGTKWTANLIPTFATAPRMHYEVEIVYLDEAANFTRSDWLGFKLYVPPEGGTFDTLTSVPLAPDFVVVGVEPDPPEWQATGWYASLGDGDPDDESVSGTGLLWKVG